MEIAIDFDGTCVKHAYPEVGADIGAARVLKRLVEEGHKLILWTMRSSNMEIEEGSERVAPTRDHLQEAVDWFAVNDIPLYGIQCNPTQHQWTSSKKCYAQLYIDDAALGCPLVRPTQERPFADWFKIEILLEQSGVLTAPTTTSNPVPFKRTKRPYKREI